MFLFQRVTVGTPYFFLHFYIYRSPQKKSTPPKQQKEQNNPKLSGNCNNSIHSQDQITENCKTTEIVPAHTLPKIHDCIFQSVELLR